MASRKRSSSSIDDDDDRDDDEEDADGEYETFKKWLDENASSSTSPAVPPKPVSQKCPNCGWETCKWISSWLDKMQASWSYLKILIVFFPLKLYLSYGSFPCLPLVSAQVLRSASACLTSRRQSQRRSWSLRSVRRACRCSPQFYRDGDVVPLQIVVI